MSVFEKAERALSLLKLVLAVSKNVDIKAIQKKYGFTKQRKTRVHILDCKKHYTFTIRDGRMKVISFFPGDPEMEIVIERLCTFKHLRHGKIPGIHPGRHEVRMMDYSVLDAWRMGDIRTYGEASTNDVLSFLDIFLELIGSIPVEKVDQIIGNCEHEK